MTEIEQLQQRVAELELAVVALTNRVNGAPMFSRWFDYASQPGLPADWMKPYAVDEPMKYQYTYEPIAGPYKDVQDWLRKQGAADDQ